MPFVKVVELWNSSQKAKTHFTAPACGQWRSVFARCEPDQAITLIERLLSTPVRSSVRISVYMTLAIFVFGGNGSAAIHPRFQKILAGPEPKTV